MILDCLLGYLLAHGHAGESIDLLYDRVLMLGIFAVLALLLTLFQLLCCLFEVGEKVLILRCQLLILLLLYRELIFGELLILSCIHMLASVAAGMTLGRLAGLIHVHGRHYTLSSFCLICIILLHKL